jgi:hypothetical protein
MTHQEQSTQLSRHRKPVTNRSANDTAFTHTSVFPSLHISSQRKNASQSHIDSFPWHMYLPAACSKPSVRYLTKLSPELTGNIKGCRAALVASFDKHE